MMEVQQMLDDKVISHIMDMGNDEAKELLIQIFSSYSNIGTVQHEQNEFVKDIKRIYLKMVRDQYEI